jgi:hypothetical protein
MRKKTPSFVAEFPLSTTAADEKKLSIRLDAARQIYNACLGKSVRRLDFDAPVKSVASGQATSRQVDGEANKARSDAFREAQSKFDFDSASIQKFGEQCRDQCWIGEHLGSHDTQTTTLRAFRAVETIRLRNTGPAAI